MQDTDDRLGPREQAVWLTFMCLALHDPTAAERTESVYGLAQAALTEQVPPTEDHPTVRQIVAELAGWATQKVLLALVFHTSLPALLFGEALRLNVERALTADTVEAEFAAAAGEQLGTESREELRTLIATAQDTAATKVTPDLLEQPPAHKRAAHEDVLLPGLDVSSRTRRVQLPLAAGLPPPSKGPSLAGDPHERSARQIPRPGPLRGPQRGTPGTGRA